VEKPASKGHGFFGLFDWGKKSKKRLFVGSASSSPDPSKQILLHTSLHLARGLAKFTC
jgi:hypothetical protein